MCHSLLPILDFQRTKVIVRATIYALSVALCLTPNTSARVLPFNEAESPKSVEDLKGIQKMLIESSDRVRKAAVSISLGEGFGSGVIISEDGLILTAAHVTAAVDTEMTVIMNDGTKLKAVSMGLNSDTDAAMMRITEKGKYPYVEVNKANDYRLGHWVFALGHSGGFDKLRGPVLRLGRIVKDSETTLHTDCKVIGGDSGGPLFDMEGRLIAIHSRVERSMEQNMHVPMREYVKHWDDMQSNKFIGEGPFAKKPVKGSGYIGIATVDSDDGVRVEKVGKASPAEKAEIKAGDIIKTLNGRQLKDKEGFKSLLQEMAEGDKVKLVILREGKELTLKLKLAKR